MKEFETLECTVDASGIAAILMSRPEVFNAFDETMISELGEAFTYLENRPDVRMVILSGSGKHFSAGADLNWMKRASVADFQWNLDDSRKFAGMLHRIYSFPRPTIAKIHGVALGGGVGLICACDIAIATENSSFAVSEAKFGILPSVIGPYLINAVGRRQAKYLALTTSRIKAKTALSMGLVQHVVPDEELDNTVSQVSADLLVGGPIAQSEIKTLFDQIPVGPISEDIRELTAQTISRVRGTDEAREGFDAFFAKRPPVWLKNS